MTTRQAPKLALAAVAAVGLYIPTLGPPMPVPCPTTIGIAGAAPSPTCASDLRECLHRSAKTDIYGARYVTADDVAKCVEAFNSCIHGTSHGGNPVPPTSTAPTNRKGATMPQRFTLKGENFDCSVSGSAVTCTASEAQSTKKITGNLSGLTMTGTRTDHFVGPSVQGCVSTVDYSWPVTYEFKPGGTGTLHMGQGQWEQTLSGSCSGTHSGSVEGADGPIEWSPTR